MESLANYSAVLFMESRVGPRAVEMTLNAYRRQLFTKGADGSETESEGPVVQGGRLQNSNNPGATNAVVYGKGTWIMHMLRRRMGDERFLKMLAELRKRFEWKAVETEDLRRLCAEFLPPGSPDKTLTEFFDQWVYSTGVPALKLTYSVKGAPGAWKLTGTVAQTEAPEDLSIAVPIEIQVGKAKPIVKIVHTASEPVQFTVDVPAQTAKAVLDPGWSVLRRP
jgi:aminopeptidase N